MPEQLVDQRPRGIPPAKVPDYVVFHPDLKGTRGCAAVRLYAILDRHVNQKTKVAWPGWRLLAKAMKCSNTLLSASMKALEGIKAIRVDRSARMGKERGGRGSNRYILLPVPERVPPEWKGHKIAKDPVQLDLGGLGGVLRPTEQGCSARRNQPAPPHGAERLKDSNAFLFNALPEKGGEDPIHRRRRLSLKILDIERTLEKSNLPDKHRSTLKREAARIEEELLGG